MKKLLTILVLVLITATGYGQLKAPYGIWITAPWRINGTTVTSSATEINLLDGALATPAEINHLVGVTSAIQTQINATVKTTGNQTIAGNKTFTGSTIFSSIPTISNVPLLTLSDSTLYYFSLVRGEAVELDLNTYTTIPAPDVSGNLMTADGTNWVSAAPTVGSGSGSGDNTLLYTYDLFVGDAGAPANGDTTWTQTNFVDNRLSVWREGIRQHRNPTGLFPLPYNGYSFQPTTGDMYFDPSLVTGQNLIIEVYDSTTVIETEPPPPAASSSLLTDLKTYYKLDEVAGTALTDAVGNKNITTDGQINQDGITGRSVHMGWKKELNGSAYNAVTNLNWSTWAVKVWFKLDSLPTETGREYTLFVSYHSPAPWWNAKFTIAQNNHLRIRVTNNLQAVMQSYGDTVSVVGRWYQVIALFRGNGLTTQIFKDGQESTEAGAQVFTGTLWQTTLGEYWGASDNVDSNEYMSGYLDEPATWSRVLTNGEILESYTKEKAGTSYPW